VRTPPPSRIFLLASLLFALGCNRFRFPDVPDGYREYAYVTNGSSNTVSVLDLVYLRPDRTLQVGVRPTGIAANPTRPEVYVVNTGTPSSNGSVSVIDVETNRIVATIPVHKLPYFIDVDADGSRAYVANSGSNSVSVLDLVRRREIGVIGAGLQPGLARISPDMRTLVVTNRGSGSVSIFSATPDATGLPLTPQLAKSQLPHLRAVFPGCPGATDAIILPKGYNKAFVACSGGHQVMAISLAADTHSGDVAVVRTADRNGPTLFTILPAGGSPNAIAVKALQPKALLPKKP
jgi:YVTN family beta-propeller protein